MEASVFLVLRSGLSSKCKCGRPLIALGVTAEQKRMGEYNMGCFSGFVSMNNRPFRASEGTKASGRSQWL